MLLLNADYSRLRTVEKEHGCGRRPVAATQLRPQRAFAGRTVVLYFNVYNNGSGAQWNHLDDVSLALCSQAEGGDGRRRPARPAGPVAADALVVRRRRLFRRPGGWQQRHAPGEQPQRRGAPLSWQAETGAPGSACRPRPAAPRRLDVSLVSGEAEAGIYQAQITRSSRTTRRWKR